MNRKKLNKKQWIAKRVATYFESGDIVNLGVGIPSLCSDFAPDEVMFQTENGFLGVGKEAFGLQKDPSYSDASSREFIPQPGGVGFDSCMSFGMIRGGRIDATVLGALQVDMHGNLASWALPNSQFGMGGAMDLVNGAKKVIVAMESCNKKGEPKILKSCTYPLTGRQCIDHIVFEYGVIDVKKDGLYLVEMVDCIELKDLCQIIEPNLKISEKLKIVSMPDGCFF